MSTQNIDYDAMELTNPRADKRVVDKLAEWLLEKNPWAYTGHKSTRTNAKPLEVWKPFHKDTKVFWFEHFGYAPEPGKDAGAKSREYALFRDALPDALRLFRSLKERKPLDQIPPVEYLYRPGQFTKDGQPAVRAVDKFAPLPTDVRSNANAANVIEDEDGAAEVNPYVNELAEVCAVDLD